MSTELTDEIKYLVAVEKGYSATYEHLSLELYSAIWESWKRNVKEIKTEMIENDLKEPGLLIDLIQNKLRNEFPLEAEESIIRNIRETFKATKKAFFKRFRKSFIEKADDFFSYSLREIDYESIEYLRNHTNWWMKHYYDRFPGENISELIQEGLKRELSTKELGNVLEDYFYGEILEDGEWPTIPGNMSPKEYFEGLSRNTISRARMNATVNSFIEAEIEEYEIIATEDGRTCDICRSMHGRVFKTSKAKQFTDQFNALDTPDDVKTQLPWIKNVSETAKPTGNLGLSFSLPPFHFNCRCNVIDHEYTVEEEAQMLLDDKAFQQTLPQDLLLTTDASNIRWNPSSIEEARMMVKIARKMKVYDKEFKSFVKKSSWLNEKALTEHFQRHQADFLNAGVELNSIEAYEQLSVDILTKGECWGIIESGIGYPQIVAILRIKDKLFTSILNVNGMQIATSFPKSGFYNDLVKRKEFYYFIRKSKLFKFMKAGKNMTNLSVRENIDHYKYMVDIMLDKERGWEKMPPPDNRILPPQDAITLLYARDYIHEDFNEFSDEERMEIKEIDERFLRDLDLVIDTLSHSYVDKKQPKEKWWYHFEEIRDGKLKVFWDEEKRVYTAE